MTDHTAKTLEQLDGEVLALPEYDSALVLSVYRLRRVPLNEFSVEDLRLMIGQSLSLEYLMPLALEHLKKNPFVAGDYYPGDLLKNVLGVRADFWGAAPELCREVQIIAQKALRQLSSLKVIDEIRKDLKEKLNEFGGEKCLE
jgi:hypothetical protein